MKKLFEGTAVAIITPFKEDKIDYCAFEKLIEKDISEGAKAIVVLGTTGESATVSSEEREKIVKFAKKVIGKRCKLIVGTGSNDFKKAYKNTVLAKKLGVDGALVVTPYYNKTTQQGLIYLYTKLCEIGIPIIMYNVPSRTGMTIELDTVKRLMKNPMIYGIKESTSDIQRIMSLAKMCRGKLALYSGEDSLNYLFYALGGQGCISVTANAFCQEVQKVYDLVKTGFSKDARKVQERLSTINKLLFCEVNPIPIKYLLSKMGYCENEIRLPLLPLEEKYQRLLDRELKKMDKESENFI